MASSGGPPKSPTSPTPSGSTARSPPHPTRARNVSSVSQSIQQHQPSAPSALRQAELPPSSPDDRFHRPRQRSHDAHRPDVERDGIHPHVHDFAPTEQEASEARVQGEIDEPSDATIVRSRLLDRHKYLLPQNCGQYNCNHGSFSPRPRYHRDYGSISSSSTGLHPEEDARSMHSFDEYGGMTPAEPASIDGVIHKGGFAERSFGDLVTAGLLGKPSKKASTYGLQRKHGVNHVRWMYVDHGSAVSYASFHTACFLTYTNAAVGISNTTFHALTGSGSTNARTSQAT